mgnify:CR=1 FL=1
MKATAMRDMITPTMIYYDIECQGLTEENGSYGD